MAGWAAYQLTSLDTGVTSPTLGPDKNMYGIGSTTSPSVGTWNFYECTPIGVVTTAGGSDIEPIVGFTNLLNDGTHLWSFYSDGYPRGWILELTPGTLAWSRIGPFGADGDTAGGVMVGPSSAVTTGINLGALPSARLLSPMNTVAAGAGPGSGGTAGYGPPTFFGSTAYAGLYLTNLIDYIPTTVAGINAGGYPRYTLPATYGGYHGGAAGDQPQIGNDGRYIYLAATAGSGGGVIVWDTTTNTGSVFGAGTTFGNCYYSMNLRRVVLDDASFNVYTMPAGGGTIVNNLGQPGPPTGIPLGFADGPNRTLWASGTSAAGYYFYQAGPFGQLVILPYRERRHGVVLPTPDEVRRVRCREFVAA